MSGWPGGQVSAVGAVLGLVAGLGAWLAVSRVPWARAPSLDERLAPYLRGIRRVDPSPVPGQRLGTPLDVVERILGTVLADAARGIERILGGGGTVRRRLDRLGGRRSVEQFRAEQVVWGLVGAGLGALAGVAATLGRGFSAVPFAGLVLVGAVIGVLGRDHALTRQVRRREHRVLSQFPAVAELLALSVVAGEGPVGAMDRVARTCHGDLADDVRRALGDARAGVPLARALEAMAARSSLPSVVHFVDGLVVAMERGTPLADVLRAQAQDARVLARRRLMEAGGRREIAMMVPVVFLLLPVTVLFAVYPGLAVLDVTL